MWLDGVWVFFGSLSVCGSASGYAVRGLMGALFWCGALPEWAGREGGPGLRGTDVLIDEAGESKFRQSKAHKNYVHAEEMNEGVLRTVGSKLTFGYFCSATKVPRRRRPRRGGETALKQAVFTSLDAKHRFHCPQKPPPCKGKAVGPRAPIEPPRGTGEQGMALAGRQSEKRGTSSQACPSLFRRPGPEAPPPAGPPAAISPRST